MKKLLLATAALLALTTASNAATCVTNPVSTYTATGFSCNLGDLVFSNIFVTPTVTGTGSVTLNVFNPFVSVIAGQVEAGLTLDYIANSGLSGSADVLWQYNVTSTANNNLINDAFLQLATSVLPPGFSGVSEVLTNGTVLSLTSAGSTTATFSPVATLGVLKDQINFSNTGGLAIATGLTNAFSTVGGTPFSVVPGPIVGAGLPGILAAMVGLWGLARRRQKRISA